MSITHHDMAAWCSELEALEELLGGPFGRWDSCRQAGLYLDGLLSAAERKNGWQLERFRVAWAHQF